MHASRLIGFIAASTLGMVFVFVVLIPTDVESENPASLEHEFIGSETCRECHADPELSESGFNIWEESLKEAHFLALSRPDPRFPEGTNDDPVVLPPDGSTWNDYAYVIGGYGWKTTFVRNDGTQVTGETNAQYNLETGEWTAYHPGEDLKFDVECFQCHVTGVSTDGSWNGVAEDSLGTFKEIGVRCEGCHGPSSLHATRAFTTFEGETDVLLDRCGDCHNNGGREAPIPVVDGFVANHTQYQEMLASRHGSISFFTCTTCHEPHVSLQYADVIGKTFNGKQISPFRNECVDCHPNRAANHPTPIECVDCHMPAASKSAVGIEYPNGGLRGDISSHIWRINTDPVSREAMYTPDGEFLKPDASGWLSVSLDFACLGCHTDADETLTWASESAKRMHVPTNTSAEAVDEAVPGQPRIVANYPNPFSETTTVAFELETAGSVELSVFNSSGQRVALLNAGQWPAGTHGVTWDGRTDAGVPVSSGVYIARLVSGQTVSSRQLLVVR